MDDLDREMLTTALTGSHQLDVIIGELEHRYPDRMPDHKLDPVDIAFRAGQVSVVRQLKQLINDG